MAKQNSNALVARPSEPVTRWNPWTEVDRMHRQMDSLFNNFFDYTPLTRLFPNAENRAAGGDFGLSADIYETDDELVLVAPIPGITPAELDIEATADSLTIRGERKRFYQNENAKVLRQSWWSAGQGAFEVSFALPVEIQPDKIQAGARNGVLELRLPKAEAAKRASVKVNVQPEA